VRRQPDTTYRSHESGSTTALTKDPRTAVTTPVRVPASRAPVPQSKSRSRIGATDPGCPTYQCAEACRPRPAGAFSVSAAGPRYRDLLQLIICIEDPASSGACQRPDGPAAGAGGAVIGAPVAADANLWRLTSTDQERIQPLPARASGRDSMELLSRTRPWSWS